MKILHLLLKNKPIAIYLFQTYREIEIDDGISQAEATNFIKNEALAQMFPCEFSKISKNTFFIEHLCILIVLSQMLQSWLGAF